MKKSDMTPEQIREVREQLKLTPTEFASRLGVSASHMYYLETGKSKLSYALGELIKTLKVS